MLKQGDSKEIIKVGLILFAITALAALVLALMNGVTAPLIQANQAKKQQLAMQNVLPEASGFSTDNLRTDSMDKTVTAVYAAEDAGYAVMVSPNGYGGAISMAVGVDKHGTVTGVDVISQSETAGLGANCTKDEFKTQFTGKTAGVTVSKNGAKENEIDAISSATITSKAVTAGVNAAIDAAAQLSEGGN